MLCEKLYELTTLGVEISLVVLAVGVRDKGYMDSAAIQHPEESGQFDIRIDHRYSMKGWFARSCIN
jgi:hypothetical protein